jgi:hypothetical protein
MLNEDYKDMLHALSEEKVRFLLVGAYALAAHGYPRATMDMDIWVMPSPEQSLSLYIEGIELHIPSIDDLIRNKRAVGRIKDLVDVEALEALKNSEQIDPADKE